MRKQISFYLGEEKPEGFTGYLAEGNLFLIFVIKENFTKEEGNKLISSFKQKLGSSSIENLSQLDDFIKQVIFDNNLPTGLSLAAVFFKDDIAYLKTINEGKIFLRRKNKVEEIICGTQTASGYLQLDDIFILTTDEFITRIKEIKNVLNKEEPIEIINEITPFLKKESDKGLIALFVKLKKEEEVGNRLFFLENNNFLSLFNQSEGKKKTLTYLLLIIIFFIFIWSVVLGYKRRKESEINNQIERTKKIVFSKLEEAEEIAFLNLERAIQLLNEAKEETTVLKEKVKNKSKKIEEIEKKITEKENQIIKKETKNYQEFYDLSVDKKEAKGDRFFLQNDFLFILDKDEGVIYRLSLEKKSLEKYHHPKIKKSSLIAAYDEKIYFLVEDEGIFQIVDKDKAKKIIEKDPQWVEIKDISTYNGNLYLLDVKSDEIYKYLAVDSGFSSKTSYFKSGEAIDLEDANSLAIDSSVYIGFSQTILKFTRGIKEEFKNNFPNKNLVIKKIYTDKEINKVYVWDKENGLIYILNKNGEYQEQIFSIIIKKAFDFVVYKDKIFLLLKNKIYSIE